VERTIPIRRIAAGMVLVANAHRSATISALATATAIWASVNATLDGRHMTALGLSALVDAAMGVASVLETSVLASVMTAGQAPLAT
jgi:hypothetical protein